jgi:hypothetical protein
MEYVGDLPFEIETTPIDPAIQAEIEKRLTPEVVENFHKRISLLYRINWGNRIIAGIVIVGTLFEIAYLIFRFAS